MKSNNETVVKVGSVVLEIGSDVIETGFDVKTGSNVELDSVVDFMRTISDSPEHENITYLLHYFDFNVVKKLVKVIGMKKKIYIYIYILIYITDECSICNTKHCV